MYFIMKFYIHSFIHSNIEFAPLILKLCSSYLHLMRSLSEWAMELPLWLSQYWTCLSKSRAVSRVPLCPILSFIPKSVSSVKIMFDLQPTSVVQRDIIYRAYVLVFKIRSVWQMMKTLCAHNLFFPGKPCLMFHTIMKWIYSPNFRWMTYVGMLFATVYGILTNLPIFWAAVIVNGQCRLYTASSISTELGAVIYNIATTVGVYLLSVLFLAYTYGRIIITMLRQRKVHPGKVAINTKRGQQQMSTHTDNMEDRSNVVESRNNPSMGNASSVMEKIDGKQLSIIKTMLMITVSFVLCWLPTSLSCLLYFVYNNIFYPELYYFSTFMIVLNISMNPFIYALSHNDVNHALVAIVCGRANLPVIAKQWEIMQLSAGSLVNKTCYHAVNIGIISNCQSGHNLEVADNLNCLFLETFRHSDSLLTYSLWKTVSI